MQPTGASETAPHAVTLQRMQVNADAVPFRKTHLPFLLLPRLGIRNILSVYRIFRDTYPCSFPHSVFCDLLGVWVSPAVLSGIKGPWLRGSDIIRAQRFVQ